jgi:transcription initiation factor TFIID subunit TAF12
MGSMLLRGVLRVSGIEAWSLMVVAARLVQQQQRQQQQQQQQQQHQQDQHEPDQHRPDSNLSGRVPSPSDERYNMCLPTMAAHLK